MKQNGNRIVFHFNSVGTITDLNCIDVGGLYLSWKEFEYTLYSTAERWVDYQWTTVD